MSGCHGVVGLLDHHAIAAKVSLEETHLEKNLTCVFRKAWSFDLLTLTDLFEKFGAGCDQLWM